MARFHYTRPSVAWTQAEVDLMLELYEAGKSDQQIVEAVGRTDSDVSDRLRWILHGGQMRKHDLTSRGRYSRIGEESAFGPEFMKTPKR